MKKKVLIPVLIFNNAILGKLTSYISSEMLNHNTEFHFLTVLPAYSLYDIMTDIRDDPTMVYKKKRAKEKLRDMTLRFHLPDDKIYFHVTKGIPKDEILAYARLLRTDLVVIPSNQPGLSTYFFGSTASAVVRHAKCAVLVVR
jgi:Universal stress protein UspA and related nucleotide-binding proteins